MHRYVTKQLSHGWIGTWDLTVPQERCSLGYRLGNIIAPSGQLNRHVPIQPCDNCIILDKNIWYNTTKN